MAPPPPRPPIICYDLQTNKNLRPQHKCLHPTYTNLPRRQTQKVTVIHERPNLPPDALKPGCWHRPLTYDFETIEPTVDMLVDDGLTELSSRKRSVRFEHQTTASDVDPITQQRTRARIPPVRPIRLQDYNPESFISHTPPKRLTTNDIRHAYGQKLKQDAIERERMKIKMKKLAALPEDIAKTNKQLEAAGLLYENVSKNYGSGHNAAKYIERNDQEYANLHKKLEEVTDTRSKEVMRFEQRAKKLHNMQRTADLKLEEQRKRELARYKAQRATLSSTLNQSLSDSSSPTSMVSSLSSPQTSSLATNRIGSSSTISFSSIGSSSVDSGHLSSPSLRSTDPQATRIIDRPNSRLRLPSALKQDKQLQTSTLLSNQIQPLTALKNRSNSMLPKTSTPNVKRDSIFHSALEDFSFYKSDPNEKTLEITDADFFEKMEDKTMIEINKLIKDVQSGFSDLYKYSSENPSGI